MNKYSGFVPYFERTFLMPYSALSGGLPPRLSRKKYVPLSN